MTRTHRTVSHQIDPISFSRTEFPTASEGFYPTQVYALTCHSNLGGVKASATAKIPQNRADLGIPSVVLVIFLVECLKYNTRTAFSGASEGVYPTQIYPFTCHNKLEEWKPVGQRESDRSHGFRASRASLTVCTDSLSRLRTQTIPPFVEFSLSRLHSETFE